MVEEERSYVMGSELLLLENQMQGKVAFSMHSVWISEMYFYIKILHCLMKTFYAGNREAAIVTPIAGTTRDLIELQINVNGYPLTLTDTAGLRSDTSDIIELEGISRAHSKVKSSDLLLIMVDSTTLVKKLLIENDLSKVLNHYLSDLNLITLDEEDLYSVSELCNMLKCIFIFNKTDLLSEKEKADLEKLADGKSINCVSCVTEDGFPFFIENLTASLKDL